MRLILTTIHSQHNGLLRTSKRCSRVPSGLYIFFQTISRTTKVHNYFVPYQVMYGMSEQRTDIEEVTDTDLFSQKKVSLYYNIKKLMVTPHQTLLCLLHNTTQLVFSSCSRNPLQPFYFPKAKEQGNSTQVHQLV